MLEETLECFSQGLYNLILIFELALAAVWRIVMGAGSRKQKGQKYSVGPQCTLHAIASDTA